jgi:valyl-tRNA synthetase
MNISPATALKVAVQSQSPATDRLVDDNRRLIRNLGRLKEITVSASLERPKAAATVLVNGASVFVLLEGIIDFAQEQARLEKEIAKLSKELTGMNRKLGNADFLAKAPAAVVNGVREKHAAMLDKQHALEATLARIQTMMV